MISMCHPPLTITALRLTARKVLVTKLRVGGLLELAALSLVLGAVAMPLVQGAVAMHASTPVAPGSEGRSVAAMVRGIAGYARWPVAPNPIRICIAGRTSLGDAWIAGEGESRTLRRVEAGARFSPTQCDIAYIGRLDPADMRATYARLRGQPVLSITDADAACRSGAMFCIVPGANTLSFGLNVDAVTRGAVKIDPRVLRLARPSA